MGYIDIKEYTMPLINSHLKYWKPRYLSSGYVPEMGGYYIQETVNDSDVDIQIRALRLDYPVWYRELEPCIYDCLERCSNLILQYNDRIRKVKQMYTDMSEEADRLRKSRIDPGTPEYYRLNDIGRSLHNIPDHINHLRSCRNIAIDIRDEARDLAKEFLNKKTHNQ